MCFSCGNLGSKFNFEKQNPGVLIEPIWYIKFSRSSSTDHGLQVYIFYRFWFTTHTINQFLSYVVYKKPFKCIFCFYTQCCSINESQKAVGLQSHDKKGDMCFYFIFGFPEQITIIMAIIIHQEVPASQVHPNCETLNIYIAWQCLVSLTEGDPGCIFFHS